LDFGLRPSAFTLIEILVAVALLSFIVLGLFAMFTQVQRAFVSSMNQVDQLEAGRAVAEMLPAEIEQLTPSGANAVTFYTTNLNSAPLTQALPGTTATRLNLLQDCFILLRTNQAWVGIGYCVRTNDVNGALWLPECGPGQLGVGSLYRWSASTNVLRSDSGYVGLPSDPSQLFRAFYNALLVPGSTASQAISNKICDGVIHFYLAAFATNGFPLVFYNGFTNACFRTNALTLGYSPVLSSQANENTYVNPAALVFWSNALPASVELQLGILEQHAVDRYNSIATPAARLNYLSSSDHYLSSRVNLFRQRIPIRNVDPLAYQ
jgi:prepilin-type N-terminal cleavage/methylation domain-containing protein